MLARDLMTRDVISVTPETPARDVARLLLDHGISAVPVIDSTGAPVGMISEGDLISRDEGDRDRRRDWWLGLLAEGQELSPDFLKSLSADEEARHLMAAPVVTVDETTDAREIARLLGQYRIKRVPVIRDGRVVGIVSRADLLRALVKQAQDDAASEPVSDADLAARLAAELRTQKWASTAAAQFEVKNGIVVLKGAVFSDAQRTALRVAAESIPGVRGVQDETQAEPARQGM